MENMGESTFLKGFYIFLFIPTTIHWGKANHFTHLPQFFTTAATQSWAVVVGRLGPLRAFAPALALGHPEAAMMVGIAPISGNSEDVLI